MDVTTLLLIWLGLLVGVGTYTDMRWREVPDWLNYAALAAALGTRAIAALAFGEWAWITAGLLGLAIAFGISAIMFYLGQWGGGDAKLLMAAGALLGFDLSIQSHGAAFLMNTILAGAAYGLLWTAVTAVRNWQTFLQQAALIYSSRSGKLALRVSLALGLALGITSFLLPAPFGLSLAIGAFFIPVAAFLSVGVRAVEKGCMIKKYPISKLTEGDWIVNDVVVNGKRITGPADLGISNEQIAKLKKFASKGKIRTVLVKEGMPFVPTFALSYLLMITVGNVFLAMI